MKATTYWLMPAKEDALRLQSVIDDLAQRFSAGKFLPHLTLFYHQGLPSVDFKDVLQEVVNGVQSFSSKAQSLECSEKFTKTFFIQFENDAALTRLYESLRDKCGVASDYSFNPHASLLYHSLSDEERFSLKKEFTDLISPVKFSEIHAIETPIPVSSKEHVESWKTLASISF